MRMMLDELEARLTAGDRLVWCRANDSWLLDRADRLVRHNEVRAVLFGQAWPCGDQLPGFPHDLAQSWATPGAAR